MPSQVSTWFIRWVDTLSSTGCSSPSRAFGIGARHQAQVGQEVGRGVTRAGGVGHHPGRVTPCGRDAAGSRSHSACARDTSRSSQRGRPGWSASSRPAGPASLTRRRHSGTVGNTPHSATWDGTNGDKPHYACTNRRVDGAMLIFDPSDYPFGSGAETNLFATSPVLWVGDSWHDCVGHPRGNERAWLACCWRRPPRRPPASAAVRRQLLLAGLDEAWPRSMRR